MAIGLARAGGVRRTAGVLSLGVLFCAACGGDATTLTRVEIDDGRLEPEPADERSRTVAVLSAPESLDAVCRLIGVSSVGAGSSRDREACSEIVDDCRGNVAAALGTNQGSGAALPPADLEPLLGCSLTLAELDACIGAALERSIAEYGGSVGCDMPTLPAVDPRLLLGSAECLAVLLRCPELIASIAPPAPPNGDGLR